jgi:hypothetical protein
MYQELEKRLSSFKSKYFSTNLLKYSLAFLSISILAILGLFSIEYFLFMSPITKKIILSIFLIYFVVGFSWNIIYPVYQLSKKHQFLSDEDVAKMIGSKISQVNDRLLTIVQLRNHVNEPIVLAASEQKYNLIREYDYNQIIGQEEVKSKSWIILCLLLFTGAIYFLQPNLLKDGSHRLIHFNKRFEIPAPFQFQLEKEIFSVYRGEKLPIEIKIIGTAIPEEIYLHIEGRRQKLMKKEEGSYIYTFDNLIQNTSFFLEGSGFTSKSYDIEVINRPQLEEMQINLLYPVHVGLKADKLTNTGNLVVPEGTEIHWSIKNKYTNKAKFIWLNDSSVQEFDKQKNDLYTTELTAKEFGKYGIKLENDQGINKDQIIYSIEVIKDEYPRLNLEVVIDSVYYEVIFLTGIIRDDYGFSSLRINYEIERENRRKERGNINLDINRQLKNQRFYKEWDLNTLKGLNEIESISFYVEVKDNDSYHGSKATRSSTIIWKKPNRKTLKEDLKQNQSKTEDKLTQSVGKSKELNELLKDLENRLKGKKDISWQDEKLLKEMLQEKLKLEELLEELKAQNEELIEKNKKQDKVDPNLLEKQEQLQNLINELMDEETRSMFEDLQKLLEENKNKDRIEDLVKKLNKKEQNLERELERTKELFKRLKFESKLNEVTNDLKELADEQEKLSEETKSESQTWEEISKEQESIKDKFDELSKELETLEELNKDLKRPEKLENTKSDELDIQNQLENAKEKIEKKDRDQGSKEQKKSAEKMKEMAEKMQIMKMDMQMDGMMEDIDNLRRILSNLLKASFGQEELINEFRVVNQSDPRFVTLSQEQLKLQDDTKIIEDSLRSLGERVFPIQPFVTKELEEMKQHQENASSALKDRNRGKALTSQQYAMTSMNNLALLLDDVVSQMQDQMAQAMGMPQQGDQNMPSPGLSEMQEELNKKVQDLKQSGKSGRELSEELSNLANEQEMIRQELQRMMEKFGQQEGGESGGKLGKDILQKMEMSEADLVNKKLTEQLIRRQKEILTRLLESEKSMREREEDEERKGETGRNYDKIRPKAFEEYLKEKQKEIDQIRKSPIQLTPFYRKEVEEYYKQLDKEQN